MKRMRAAIAAIMLGGAISSALAGCGNDYGDGSADHGSGTSQPTTVMSSTGTIATDNWGYTGSTETKLTAPAKTVVVLQPRTLLRDGQSAAVSGISSTKLSFSSDATTLSAAQAASAPGTLVSYVDLYAGAAKSALPAFSVTVDVTPVAAGETLKVASYDPLTARWLQPQPVVVSTTGMVTFSADGFAFWGIFR